MTAHELAKKLLDGPDVPVCMYDWSVGDQIPTLIEYSQAFVGSYTVFDEEEHRFQVCGLDTRFILLDASGHPWDEPEGGWKPIEEDDPKYSTEGL